MKRTTITLTNETGITEADMSHIARVIEEWLDLSIRSENKVEIGVVYNEWIPGPGQDATKFIEVKDEGQIHSNTQ